MLRDAALVAGKDLRIEARSRVTANQIAPFAVLVLVLFAFALEPDRGLLTRAFTVIVRAGSCTTGSTKSTIPVNSLPGSAATRNATR